MDRRLIDFAQRAAQSKDIFEFVALAVTHQGCRQCRSIQGAMYIASSVIAMWAARGTLAATLTAGAWLAVFATWWLWLRWYLAKEPKPEPPPAASVKRSDEAWHTPIPAPGDPLDLTQFKVTSQK